MRSDLRGLVRCWQQQGYNSYRWYIRRGAVVWVIARITARGLELHNVGETEAAAWQNFVEAYEQRTRADSRGNGRTAA